MSKGPSIDLAFQDNQMTAVSKYFFFEGMMLPVNIFLKMNSGHYLTIGKKTEKAHFSDLHSYNNPQTKVYVRRNDHTLLIQYVTELTGRVITQKSIPDSVKVKFLMGLTEHALSSFDEKGVANIQQLQRISQFIGDLASTVSNFDEVHRLLSELPDDQAKHAIATTMIALSLCDKMQVTLKTAKEKLALGCLLHDVGLKHIPAELLERPRHLWTHDEAMIYEAHPLKGAEMLRNIKDISNDILLIVAEHHENAVGTGFPKKLRDIKISPLGRIAAVANAFTDLVFGHFGQEKGYTPHEAVCHIEEIMGQPFNKQAFLALKTVISKK